MQESTRRSSTHADTDVQTYRCTYPQQVDRHGKAKSERAPAVPREDGPKRHRPTPLTSSRRNSLKKAPSLLNRNRRASRASLVVGAPFVSTVARTTSSSAAEVDVVSPLAWKDSRACGTAGGIRGRKEKNKVPYTHTHKYTHSHTLSLVTISGRIVIWRSSATEPGYGVALRD